MTYFYFLNSRFWTKKKEGYGKEQLLYAEKN